MGALSGNDLLINIPEHYEPLQMLFISKHNSCTVIIKLVIKYLQYFVMKFNLYITTAVII